jgi:hypothetical protein
MSDMSFHPLREGLHDFSSIKVKPKGQESAHSQNKSGPTFWDYPQLGGVGAHRVHTRAPALIPYDPWKKMKV